MMGFLCNQHKQQLHQNPQQAEASWCHTLISARELSQSRQWDKAVVFYGNALEMAEIIMLHSPGRDSQERYIRTATELMHAVRNSQYVSRSLSLFSQILNRLEHEDNRQFNSDRLAPLKDAAFGDLNDVNRWMEDWYQQRMPVRDTLH